MQVIKNRQLYPNRLQHLADDDPLPAGNNEVTVSLARWRSQRDQLRQQSGVGVRLAPADEVADLVPDLDVLKLITLEFKSLTEGRGYSQARLLRENHGYRGEIRALGVVRDQLAFLERCGVDVFELLEQEDGAAALAAFNEIPVRYQPAADDERSVLKRRGKRNTTQHDLI